MKRCPTCKREFEDSITYCLDDGTPLVAESPPVNPSPGGRDIPTAQYGQLGGKATVAGSVADLPVMPTYSPTPQKRRVWPWVVAGLAILFLLAIMIAAVIAIPKIVGTSRNSKRDVAVETPSRDQNNAGTPSVPASDNAPPTDESAVLSQLTELEKQWTVANIEGDKDTLDQILADDYRGGDPPHTKQQYLDQLQPDATVKSWELQDLQLHLDGDRATIDGYLRQEATSGVQVYSFTDEFVWRDRRWQATGSRSTRVK